MANRLIGKVALVFGAGGPREQWSNGKATAVAFAREGASVVAVDRDYEAVQETTEVIRSEGFESLPIIADVTNTEQVEAAVRSALKKFGRIDILYNNVGIAYPGGPLDLTDQEFQRVFDVNVASIHRTTRAVLPTFFEQGFGVIVNVSSLASIRYSGYDYFAYYSSKAAVNHATVAIALQYADKNIRANVILPGVIDTPLVYNQIATQYSSIDEMRSARQNAVPMKRTGSPWDVANAAVFLASDEASFITGVALPVDGGHSCVIPGLA